MLTVVVRLIDADAALTSWRDTADSLSATGDLGGAVLRLSGVRSTAQSPVARLVFRGSSRTVELRLPAPGAAWPGQIIVTDLDGETRYPTRYSDSHRSSLLALATAAESGGAAGDLNHYLTAVAAIRDIRERP